jgi:hypothetical protein
VSLWESVPTLEPVGRLVASQQWVDLATLFAEVPVSDVKIRRTMIAKLFGAIVNVKFFSFSSGRPSSRKDT